MNFDSILVSRDNYIRALSRMVGKRKGHEAACLFAVMFEKHETQSLRAIHNRAYEAGKMTSKPAMALWLNALLWEHSIAAKWDKAIVFEIIDDEPCQENTDNE